MNGKREFGDYQTPPDFALQLCQLLRDGYGLRPSVVIEPTCGVGGFLAASQLFQAEEYYGIEINPRYCEECRGRLAGTNALVINASIFDYPVRSLVRSSGEVLIIGNPPWVTSSDLSVLGSSNTPHKSNFKGAVGLAALTGDSNFDICETIILQMLTEFRGCTGAVAMLCKKSVSRRIFQEAKRLSVPFTQCDFLEIDARRVFGVSVEAGMLVMRLGGGQGILRRRVVFMNLLRSPYTAGALDFEKAAFIAKLATRMWPWMVNAVLNGDRGLNTIARG